jgi:hypothetical protein
LGDTFVNAFPTYDPYVLPVLSKDGDPDVDDDRHRVGYSISTLKHEFDFTLKGICFRLRDREAVRSFQLEYHVSAAELPEAMTGVLHIVVDKRSGNLIENRQCRGTS